MISRVSLMLMSSETILVAWLVNLRSSLALLPSRNSLSATSFSPFRAAPIDNGGQVFRLAVEDAAVIALDGQPPMVSAVGGSADNKVRRASEVA